MKTLLVFTALVGAAFCADINLDAIIDQVLLDTDIDPADGIISASEITNELVVKWDVNPQDGKVTKHEFVQGWVERYNDNHDTTNAFFDNMDTNKDHILTDIDLLMQAHLIDTNGDLVVTADEFRNYIHLVHPSGHGHNG